MQTSRLFTLTGLLLICARGFTSTGDTTRVSLSSAGVEANAPSYTAAVSGNGRYVLFSSEASNLVPGDANGVGDVFVYDRILGVTQLVSLTSTGGQPRYGGFAQDISDDGRFVLFGAASDDVVPGDTNGQYDLFVRDLQNATTTRVSVSTSGGQSNGRSGDWSAISGDGNVVVFRSDASNLVPSDTNSANDVFTHNLATGVTTRVSVNTAGEQGFAGFTSHSHYQDISFDGRYVTFDSYFKNLATGDTNFGSDVFVHDCQTGETTRVSVSSNGAQDNVGSYSPSISADGRYIAFDSAGSTLTPMDLNNHPDILVHDRQNGTTTRISDSGTGVQGNADSIFPHISADGRVVNFYSDASNLVGDDTNRSGDQFAYDCVTGYLRRVSVTSTSYEGYNGATYWPAAISGNGQFIVFDSDSPRFVGDDHNLLRDVFLHEVGPANEMLSFTLSRPVVAGQNYTAGTVLMATSAPAHGLPISISETSPSITSPTTITIPAGSASKVFGITTIPVSTSSVNGISARFGHQVLTATLTLMPLVPTAFQFSPSPVVGGNNVLTRLVINGVAGSGGCVVFLSDDSAFCVAPSSVTVPAGGTQATFSISTSVVSSTQFVTVTATTPQGSKTGLLIIRP